MDPAQRLSASGVDLSALEGISPEQLAAIAHLFQSGAIPVPSAPDPAPAFTNNLPQQHLRPGSAVPTQSNPPLSDLGGRQQNGKIPPSKENEEVDREDGEVDEDEPQDTYQEPGLLHAPPTGPHSAAANGQRSVGHISAQPPTASNGIFPSANGVALSSTSNGPAVPSQSVQDIQSRSQSAADHFIVEMVNAGYTFDQLAHEVSNRDALRRKFEQLGLSTPSEKNAATRAAEATVTPATDENAKLLAAKRAPAVKAPAVNRSEYLARLQAAKNKKSELPAPTAKPSEQPPPPSDPSKAVANVKTAGTAPAADHQQPSVPKIDKNELLRQRLAAVKAEYAAKQAAKQNADALLRDVELGQSTAKDSDVRPSNDQPLSSSTPQTRLGDGLADLAARVEQDSAHAQAGDGASPVNASTGRLMSGLPGLFMMSSPVQKTSISSSLPQTLPGFPNVPTPPNVSQRAASAAASDASGNALTITVSDGQSRSRKRPVAADFDDAPLQPTPIKRPFGQSRGNSEDESMIIEDSDDEIEDNSDSEEAQHVTPQTRPFRDVGPLSDFPPRSNLRPQMSAPGTPAGTRPTTPGGTELQRMRHNIEEMNKKIAEMEKRKGSAKPVAAPVVPSNSTPAPPATEDQPFPRQSTPRIGNIPFVAETIVRPSSTASTTILQDASITNLPPPDHTSTMAPEEADEEKENAQLHLEEVARREESDLAEAMDAAIAAEAGPQASSLPGFSTTASVPHTMHDGAKSQQIHEEEEEKKEEGEDEDYDDMEDGEVTDDSISNFYATAPVNGTESIQVAQEDHANARSSSMSIDDGMRADSESMQLDDSPAPSAEESDMYQEDTAALEQVSQPLASQATFAQTQEQDEEEEDEDEDDEESSDEDDDEEEEEDEEPDGNSVSSSDKESGEIEAADDETVQPGSTNRAFNEHSTSDTGTSVLPGISNATHLAGNLADDDLAPELQPSAEQQNLLTSKTEPSNGPQPESESKSYFTSYVSPLTRFNVYRGHAEHARNFPVDLASTTYAHHLDPNVPMCPYEVAGGVCNDPHCEYQHFPASQRFR